MKPTRFADCGDFYGDPFESLVSRAPFANRSNPNAGDCPLPCGATSWPALDPAEIAFAIARWYKSKLPMHPLETYLQGLRTVRSAHAGVEETSYYTPLANLLNEVGKTLKPKVKCIMSLQDTGAGLPDGGLFAEEQIKNDVKDVLAGAVPARGAIEAKPASADARK